MSNGLRGLLLVSGLMAGAVAQADVIDWLDLETRPNTKDLKSVYVGVGLTNALVHANAEAPTKYGNVYAKVGQFYDGEGVAGVLGWRYPYAYTGTDQNGYYLGGFVGHVENDRLDHALYNRLGGGLELSYLWSNTQRITAASVAFAAGVEKTAENGTKKRAKPMVLFSYSFGVGAF
jgi:hypothetical protein